jgi:hypothetical protein
MSIALYTLLQNEVEQDGGETLTLDQLKEAAHNVSTAQEPIIDSRVKTITKEIIKDGELWLRPTVAVFDDTHFLVDGRHRNEALDDIATNYYVNALGKIVAIPEGGIPAGGSAIDPLINCNVIKCFSMKTVARLQMAYNGSRSMTPAEKLLVKASSTKLTPSEIVKQSLARKLQTALGVTFQTGLSMASRISAKVKTFIYSTEEQLDELVEMFADYIEAHPENVPGSMSREYKVLVDNVIYQQVSGFDEEGNARTISILESWASSVSKPEKKAPASKTNRMAKQLAVAMQLLKQSGLELPAELTAE